MADSRIADDAFVLTETGPALVPQLVGGDRLWGVARDGSLELTDVERVDEPMAATARRLLTTAGDIVIADGSLAMTADGPLSGGEMEDAMRRGRPPRLDVILPTDLPRPRERPADRSEVCRSCLAEVPGGVIALPAGTGVADHIREPIEAALAEAGVEHRTIEDGRWVAFVVGDIALGHDACRLDFCAQADLLSDFTVWEADEGWHVSRVRMSDHRLRRRLLSTLVGALRPFEVKWLPGYRPVESRVLIGTDRKWPARLPLAGVLREQTSARVVRLGRDVDPVVSLAVTSASTLG